MLDLHNYGRSLRPGQVPGQVSSLTEYDDDIAAALVARGRRVVAQMALPIPAVAEVHDQQRFGRAFLEEARKRLGAVFDALAGRERPVVREQPKERPLVLLGHSTGGLTLSLWAARHRAVADAVVPNSPWLEFQACEMGRAVVAPLIQARSRFHPLAPLRPIDPGFYTRAVSSRFDGEWEDEQKWRPDRGFPVTPAFLNAVFQGQAPVARGVGMFSEKSYLQPKWSGDALAAGVVPNVDTVARRALELGPDVTLHRVAGAFHDIFLSPAAIRVDVYAGLGRWVEAALDSAARERWEGRKP